MNPRFKPLITPTAEDGPAQRPFNLKIMPAATSDAPFKPLSSVLPAARSGAAGGGPAHDPEGVMDPKLETKRQGDQITRISVTCNCGRLHEIECEY